MHSNHFPWKLWGRSSKYSETQEECHHNFYQETRSHRNSFLERVGCKSSSSREPIYTRCYSVEYDSSEYSTDQLRYDIWSNLCVIKLPSESQRDRNSRIYMSTRYMSECISYDSKRESKSKCHSEYTYNRSSKYSSSTTTYNEHSSSKTLCFICS